MEQGTIRTMTTLVLFASVAACAAARDDGRERLGHGTSAVIAAAGSEDPPELGPTKPLPPPELDPMPSTVIPCVEFVESYARDYAFEFCVPKTPATHETYDADSLRMALKNFEPTELPLAAICVAQNGVARPKVEAKTIASKLTDEDCTSGDVANGRVYRVTTRVFSVFECSCGTANPSFGGLTAGAGLGETAAAGLGR